MKHAESGKREGTFFQTLPGILIEVILLTALATGISTAFGRIAESLVPEGSFWEELLTEYVSAGILGTVIAAYLHIRNRRLYDSMRPRYLHRTGIYALAGLIAGFLMNGLLVLMAYLAGNITIGYRGMRAGMILLALLAVFYQSVGEEVHDRIFIHGRISERYPLAVAVLCSAVIFSLMHVFNTGVTALSLFNILLGGIFYALSLHYFENIWFAFMHHLAWNFTQQFLFGLPNSGIGTKWSICMPLETATSGFFYNAVFGVEGCFACTILLLITILALVLIGKKRFGSPVSELFRRPYAAAEGNTEESEKA